MDFHWDKFRGEWVYTMLGYQDKPLRDDVSGSPMTSLQWRFHDGDHPVSELDADLIDITRWNEYENYFIHIGFLHILAIAQFAQARLPTLQEGEDLTPMEAQALQFVDAVSVFEEVL